MAQSKYILATYSRKPGRVNKHRMLPYLILATYSQKPGQINKHRIVADRMLTTYSRKPSGVNKHRISIIFIKIILKKKDFRRKHAKRRGFSWAARPLS